MMWVSIYAVEQNRLKYTFCPQILDQNETNPKSCGPKACLNKQNI